jgi:hypothetical protein
VATATATAAGVMPRTPASPPLRRWSTGALLVAACCGVALPRGAHGSPVRASFAQPDWGYYHKTDEIFAMLEAYAAACPALTCTRVSEGTQHLAVRAAWIQGRC